MNNSLLKLKMKKLNRLKSELEFLKEVYWILCYAIYPLNPNMEEGNLPTRFIYW